MSALGQKRSFRGASVSGPPPSRPEAGVSFEIATGLRERGQPVWVCEGSSGRGDRNGLAEKLAGHPIQVLALQGVEVRALFWHHLHFRRQSRTPAITRKITGAAFCQTVLAELCIASPELRSFNIPWLGCG
jgi:hypothetical protein